MLQLGKESSRIPTEAQDTLSCLDIRTLAPTRNAYLRAKELLVSNYPVWKVGVFKNPKKHPLPVRKQSSEKRGDYQAGEKDPNCAYKNGFPSTAGNVTDERDTKLKKCKKVLSCKHSRRIHVLLQPNSNPRGISLTVVCLASTGPAEPTFWSPLGWLIVRHYASPTRWSHLLYILFVWLWERVSTLTF